MFPLAKSDYFRAINNSTELQAQMQDMDFKRDEALGSEHQTTQVKNKHCFTLAPLPNQKQKVLTVKQN